MVGAGGGGESPQLAEFGFCSWDADGYRNQIQPQKPRSFLKKCWKWKDKEVSARTLEK